MHNILYAEPMIWQGFAPSVTWLREVYLGSASSFIFLFFYLIGVHGRMFTERCWLLVCIRLNGPLRQYFSLYRAVSKREGERKEK